MDQDSLIKIINQYAYRDSSFIKNYKEFKDLITFLNSFFDSNFKFEKLKKIRPNVYVYNNYIIKISGKKYPDYIPDLPIVVKTYFRKYYEFYNTDYKIGFEIKIQDYLYPSHYCSEKELYSLYKTLRDNGYEWMDAKVGNAVNYKGKSYIVDTDYIYKTGEDNYINQSKLSAKFQKEYNKNITS